MRYAGRLGGLIALGILAAFFIPVFAAHGAVLSPRLDVMSRDQISTASNHQIRFTTPTGVDAASDTIALTFGSGLIVAVRMRETLRSAAGLPDASEP